MTTVRNNTINLDLFFQTVASRSSNSIVGYAVVYILRLIPYIWLFWLCEILALLGQNRGKEIMAHINFGSPRV